MDRPKRSQPDVIRQLVRAVEDWWFDTTRSVHTSDMATLQGLTLVGENHSGYMYVPVRVANARAALRNLGAIDLSGYTFIDLGSGRGRMLFVAAEYPFRRIVGIEFAAELHHDASRNIKRYRCSKQKCKQIESVNADAAEYEFPREKLVLYLFNPFGPDVLRSVLERLRQSLEQCPREAILILIYPELAPVLKTVPWAEMVKDTPRYQVYRLSAVTPAAY